MRARAVASLTAICNGSACRSAPPAQERLHLQWQVPANMPCQTHRHAHADVLVASEAPSSTSEDGEEALEQPTALLSPISTGARGSSPAAWP